MKGIILSGGAGTRLYPLTKVTSKQLLPIYDKPMIYYPLEKLIKAGVKEILIIVAPDHCGDYMRVLGSGKDFGPGVRFTYEIQDKPEGLAQAFLIAENFLDDGDSSTLILGDNIFDDDITEAIASFESGAKIFVTKVPKEDLSRLGNVVLDKDFKVLDIEEKPKNPRSPYAQPGIYIYDNKVVEAAKTLKPSPRGELEITDLNNWYREKGELSAVELKGTWIDAGTIDAYFEANAWARNKRKAEETAQGLTPV